MINHSVSRFGSSPVTASRHTAWMFGLSTLALVLCGGLAQAAEDAEGFGNQAEWAQKYDAAPQLEVQRTTTPTLSPQTVAATEQAIQTYQGIVAKGGWAALQGATNLHVGSKGNVVVALRQRLAISGDLDQNAGMSPIFDTYVEAGVKRFQVRNGLSATGVVTPQTLAEMNVTADIRLRQLETNLVRLRSFSANLGQRFVMANIPAAAVETVENGVIFSHHAAGVGKIDRQSPVMQTKAVDINFNPFWTVPASIIRKDLIPKMQADPNYLTSNHIRTFNKDGQEVSPSSINWNSLDATNYKFREDPSVENSLGVVRINIANPMASTCMTRPPRASSETIFALSRPAVSVCRMCAIMSSGCFGTRRDGIDRILTKRSGPVIGSM